MAWGSYGGPPLKKSVYVPDWRFYIQPWSKVLGKIKRLSYMFYTWLELKTLEWDILNPDYLIWVSNSYNGHTFDFILKPFFLG